MDSDTTEAAALALFRNNQQNELSSTSNIDSTEEISLINEDEAALRAGFRIGFSEDKNKKYRRTMEDAHCFVYNFADIDGQGWFAVYDGHAGKAAAEWCGKNVHKTFLSVMKDKPELNVPEALNHTFMNVDKQLGETKGMFSGCTAVVAFMKVESRLVDNVLTSKKVLYTANVGDARAVLSRNKQAIRLTYDHKGSDANEARRIIESGGFILKNRVNGVLAVTRSLGDVSMKEWVIGNPYTSEIVLDDLTDEFLILACDGVWDVCSDQDAVDLVHDIKDPQEAAEALLNHSLKKFSTDNLSVMVIRFGNEKV